MEVDRVGRLCNKIVVVSRAGPFCLTMVAIVGRE